MWIKNSWCSTLTTTKQSSNISKTCKASSNISFTYRNIRAQIRSKTSRRAWSCLGSINSRLTENLKRVKLFQKTWMFRRTLSSKQTTNNLSYRSIWRKLSYKTRSRSRSSINACKVSTLNSSKKSLMKYFMLNSSLQNKAKYLTFKAKMLTQEEASKIEATLKLILCSQLAWPEEPLKQWSRSGLVTMISRSRFTRLRKNIC